MNTVLNIFTPLAEWFATTFPVLFAITAGLVSIFWLGMKVNQLYGRFTKVEETCKLIADDKLPELSRKVDRLETYMNAKFDAIEQRFADIEKSIRSLTEAVINNTTATQAVFAQLMSERNKKD